MAPPGCESLMVLAPVANLDSGLDWEAAKEGFAEKLIAFLESWGLADLREHIEFQRIYTPLDFQSDFNAVRGNAFGLEPKLSQTGWFRPHNRSEDIPNLYFTGAGTHPGAGVPGVLLSAEAAEACILEDFPRMRDKGARPVVGPGAMDAKHAMEPVVPVDPKEANVLDTGDSMDKVDTRDVVDRVDSVDTKEITADRTAVVP